MLPLIEHYAVYFGNYTWGETDGRTDGQTGPGQHVFTLRILRK